MMMTMNEINIFVYGFGCSIIVTSRNQGLKLRNEYEYDRSPERIVWHN